MTSCQYDFDTHNDIRMEVHVDEDSVQQIDL